MKRMLLITEGFPFGTSEESFLQNEYNALSKQFDITILSKGTDPLPIQKNYENERIVRFDEYASVKLLGKAVLNKDTAEELTRAVRNKSTSSSLIYRCKEILGYADRALVLKPLIRRIVKEQHIDIIYTFWCKPATLASVWLKREFKDLKVISRFHGIDLYNERRRGGWQPFKTLVAKALDEPFFVSECGRKYFCEHWQRDGAVHYLGTKARVQIEENGSDFVLVSCSNLIPIKRVDKIISMLAEIPENVHIKWYHFGDGVSRTELEAQADTMLGAKTNIEYFFEGHVNNDDLVQKYIELKPSLFITTSSTEGGAPVSIQEAFSLGIPCLGTAAGGIPEAIEDGYNGILVEENAEISELAEKVTAFCKLSRSQRAVFRNNSYTTWREKFNAEVNAKQFAEAVAEIVSR